VDEKVGNLFRELVKRAYKAYQIQETVTNIKRMFECPECGGTHLEYRRRSGEKEIFKCLMADCGFTVLEPPSIEELQNFFEGRKQKRRYELINTIFQGIKDDDDEHFSWGDVFKFQ